MKWVVRELLKASLERVLVLSISRSAFADSTAVVSYDSTLVSPSEITARVAAVGGGDLYSATLKR